MIIYAYNCEKDFTIFTITKPPKGIPFIEINEWPDFSDGKRYSINSETGELILTEQDKIEENKDREIDKQILDIINNI